MPNITSSYVHSLNPFAIQFTENFGIRWYGLAYLCGFIAGYYIIRFMARRGPSPLNVELSGDLVFTVALGTIIGGRLGYCLFYNPSLFTDFRNSFPFWGALAVNEGGMASHGGIIGIAVACYIFARQHNLPTLHLMDLTTLGGAIGIFFGRIANFVNGELVGRIVESPVAWAVKFPQDIWNWAYTEPTRLKTLAPVASKLGITEATWLDLVSRMHSDSAASSTVNNMLQRIISAVQSHSLEVTTPLTPLLDARHPSQIYEALLEGLLVFSCLIIFWRKPRKPGAVTALFFIIYAVVRIIGEQFRLPDAQIGFQLLGLTRGQWLSFGLLGLGVLLAAFVSRQKSEFLCGWYKSTQKA